MSNDPAGVPPAPDAGVTCAGCGVASASLPLGWSTQTSARGADCLCDRCTRDNVRSIEAKLDEGWW